MIDRKPDIHPDAFAALQDLSARFVLCGSHCPDKITYTAVTILATLQLCQAEPDWAMRLLEMSKPDNPPDEDLAAAYRRVTERHPLDRSIGI